MRHLTNIFRRLYRIFAHAWFQHRDVFWEVEGHDGLYVFFKTVCDMYSLIPHDNYTIPPEAEGPDAVLPEEEPADDKRRTILRKDEDPFGDPRLGTGATTRRHKHSPSTGSRVTTITESAEDLEESPEEPSPLREALAQSPEPRPVSVLEVPTETVVAAVTDDTVSQEGEPLEEPIEEPREPAVESQEPAVEPQEQAQEQTPQEATEQSSETPEEQETPEQLEAEKPEDTKTEEIPETAAAEIPNETMNSEDAETKTEPEQEASPADTKPEAEKEES
jgi:hypothetical protein